MTRDELLKRYTDGKLYSSHANLSGADLRYTNLPRAKFSGANLRCVNLSHANLSGSDFRCADLCHANFSGSDLSRANFSGADLSHANLRYTNLFLANLSGAELSYANLYGAKYKDVVIKHVRVFSALYRYQVWAIIAEDNSEWIRLGCFFRKREEWNENFWNNDEEFPNDNSEDSNMRLAAFNFACKWIDERKHTMEKTK